jgi:hypothetical protein
VEMPRPVMEIAFLVARERYAENSCNAYCANIDRTLE